MKRKPYIKMESLCFDEKKQKKTKTKRKRRTASSESNC